MGRRFWVTLLGVSLLLSLASGCAYYSAEKEMKDAQALISELKAQGGDRLTPYEYTSAEKFLEVSRLEFEEYDYKAAKNFATFSKSAAEAGLAEVKKKK